MQFSLKQFFRMSFSVFIFTMVFTNTLKANQCKDLFALTHTQPVNNNKERLLKFDLPAAPTQLIKITTELKSLYQKLKQSSTVYKNEVIRTRGARLFVKDPVENVIRLGFVKEKSQPYFKNRFIRTILDGITYLPDQIGAQIAGQQNSPNGYTFTPFRGLYHSLVDRPITYLSKGKKVTAFFSKMPILIVSAVMFFNQLDASIHQDYLNKSAQFYTQNQEAVQHDIRFEVVREVMKTEEISQEALQALAYELQITYNKFYHAQAKMNKSATLKENLEFINDPQFIKLFTNEIKLIHSELDENDPAFIFSKDSTRTLSEKSKNTVIQLAYEKLARYRFVDALLDQPEMWSKNMAAANENSFAKKFDGDEFVLKILDFYRSGKLNKQQTKNYLIEYADWLNKFSLCEVYNIQMRKYNSSKNVYTDEVYTILDFKNEILDEI